MSKGICVNTNSQEFKSLMNQYDISSGDLELALHQLPNAGESMSLQELSDYIEQYFNFNTSYIEENNNYEKIVSIYDEYQKLSSISDKERAIQLFKQAQTIFNNNVRLFQDTDNNWRINVAKPISKALNDEYESILKNAPRNEQGRLLAPNGKPSNLNEKQYAQVRTKTFKEWFGDWENDPANASKVVDENGEPLVVYHGSKNGNFNIFNYDYLRKTDNGFYFTSDKEYAKQFGDIREFFLNIKNPNLTNVPLNIDTVETLLTVDYIKGTDGIQGHDDANTNENLSKSKGQEYVAIRSNQIKSATDNIGTFSTTNNRIDRFTEQINDTINYLEQQGITINKTFEGSDIKSTLDDFKSTLNKVIESYQDTYHYDLGFAEIPFDELESSNDTSDSYYQYLQKLSDTVINKLQSQGKSIQIIPDTQNSIMSIDSSGNTIKLYYNPNLLFRGINKLDYILAHELVHSVTSNAVNNTVDNIASKEEQQFSDEVWNIIVDLYNNKQFHWEFGFNLNDKEGRASHIKEFIANVMTNPKLQKELAQIKINGKNKSLWNRFVNAVKKLLNNYLGLDITGSYLEKLMNTVSSYIENQKSNIGNTTIDYYTEGNKQFDIKKEIINKIKEFSQNRVTFDAETHTYYLDGKQVDTTASKEAHGETNIPEEYTVVSSRIGNTVDKFGRIFFNKNISEKERLNQLSSIPNLNRMDKNQLFLDFERFKQYLDDKLGENNYEVVTDEIPIVSKYRCLDKEGKPITKTIGGTIDILVVDNKGNLYIYDMKTKRINTELEWREGTKTGYDKQLMIYKAMLEANWPELAGKIKELKLIRFDVSYPSPIENEYLVDGEQLILDGVPIQNHGDYTAPTLSTVSNGLINVTQTTLKNMEFETLENEDKSLLEEELGEEKELPLESSQDITQTESLYNPGVISATERRFLTNTAMYYASYIITQLQNSSKANSAFFGKEFTGVDFTKMSRKDIIDYIGIPKILNYIKEAYFNPDNRDDIEDFNVLDKLEVIYNNWGAATMSAYSKLISLEDVTIIPTDEVKKDDISFNDENLYDSSDIEEKEREYWQVGLRQVSARSSLSIELRRIFERMPIVDSEGNYVTDEYGYGFMTFIDSGKTIDSIYNWITGCTTMSEMEKVLTEKAEFHPWLNTILDKIKEEPLRSKFFHNFRKQNVKYSIVTVDTDKEGNKSYNVNIINTSEPSKVLLERVTTAYNEGLLKSMIIPLKGSIDGKGKVNIDSVTKIKNNILKLISDVSNKLAAGKLHSYLNNPKKLQEFVNLLNDTGIIVDIDILKEAFSKDSKYKNKENANVFKILKELMYIADTLLGQKDNPAYNPIEKGTEHNIYGNYRNIVNILSDYIHDSIEASTYENGKMYYSFVLPSYMGKLIDNLKNTLKDKNKFDKFIQSEYGRYRFFKDGDSWKNEWLKQLVRNPKMREVLDYKTQLMYDGVDYTELSELGYTLSLMQEYFYDKNKKYAWYRIPILANKPSSEFVKFTRYSGLRYREQILAGLKNVFDQELMRIKTVLERVNNDDINKIGTKDKIVFDLKESMITDSLKKKIKDKKLTIKDFVKNKSLVFHGSGAEFKFLDVLNNELIEGTELGQLIIDKINGKKVNEEEFNKLFNDTIKSYMNNIVFNEINHWRYIGLFDTVEKEIKGKDGKKETIKKYKYVSNLGKNEEEIKSNLEEYIWNDMFATINIIELTATDLAYYKNVEEFQKRYMQIHAPSMKFNTEANVLHGSKYSINGKYSADGMERTIYLADCIEKSEIIDNIKIAFDNKIATLSGIEKEHMKMTRDMVLSEFEKINVADAQGYSSPTSYRKKMGMSGRWTEEMEEAYNRIVSGNYNINDLNIIWQPLKPFVYSQIPKSSGATTMKELKVPVQNKNSEYMLFLADAIMRGDSQKNKLVAIFDFMEDSAFDGRVSNKGKVIKQGKYNGVGIDTVQFVSAVNSGSMGAIDINDIDDYEGIKSKLNASVYYNSDKSETSDNAMDRYNDQYVHTIPYEDYGLQQEVPAHLVDHEQLMGSQMRILSISDITPGTKFEINGEIIDDKSLIDEYQNLIAKNINESFKQLIKEFKIKGTRKEENKAISDLLIKTILKDQRYGSDLLRACSLDKDGEFIIPLSDPIQSTRIQQLLNSIIKNRINKQTITGGPVVQVSSFGLSDDLKIVFDENDKGKVKYFECYIPIPSKELEKALTKSDGSLMTMEEAIKKGIITENMRKAIGYRIPTEHKYSMAPLMIKGFLPKSAGEGIMLPKEITKLAGSDKIVV